MKKWFANLLTTGNLICGILSILMAFDGRLITASLLIVCAAIFDAFDGKAARYFGSSSSFGLQFDSQADMVSFGVAPAMLVYTFTFHNLGIPGVVVTIIPIIAAAARLARFNSSTGGKSHDFVGLSSPLHAVLVAALIMMCIARWGVGTSSNLVAAIVVISSLLMVSNIPLAGLPRFTLKEHGTNLIKIATLIILLVFFAFDPLRNGFPAIVVLITMSFIAGIIYARRGDREDSADDEEETVTIP